MGETELVTRGAVFVALLTVLAAAEAAWPRHHRERPRAKRWLANVGLLMLDTTLLRVFQPAGVIAAALWAESRGLGASRQFDLPVWLGVVVTLVLLDLAVYLQHVAFHRVPWLWRLHRVHHADVDVDVSTGLRFHPIEMLLSMGLKSAVVVAWGGSATTVLVFEILLNATSMFTHANLALPIWLDRLVRVLVVTPDMHRVHHSVEVDECNSNFGFNLSCWDRWFGTYRPQPRGCHHDMPLGLQSFRSPDEIRVARLITQPFRRDPSRRQDLVPPA